MIRTDGKKESRDSILSIQLDNDEDDTHTHTRVCVCICIYIYMFTYTYVYMMKAFVIGILKCIIMNYLEKGKTINGQYFTPELYQLKEVIKSKHREKLRTAILLLQDNIPVHTTQFAMAEAAICGFKLLPYPSYSPDLAPYNFYLFP